MKLNDQHLGQFRDDGYVFLPDLFAPNEVAVLRGEIDRFIGLEREKMRDEQGELFGALAPAVHVAEYILGLCVTLLGGLVVPLHRLDAMYDEGLGV